FPKMWVDGVLIALKLRASISLPRGIVVEIGEGGRLKKSKIKRMTFRREAAMAGLALVICEVTLFGQATSPHLGTPIKQDADSPVVIQWDSDPAGKYTV